MSGLTAVSGLASLLLLLVPAKPPVTSLTCCLAAPASLACTTPANISLPLLQFSEWSGRKHLDQENPLLLPDVGDVVCGGDSRQVGMQNPGGEGDCWEVECGPGPAWTRSLVLYTALRATLDVLRASSLMMFEVGPDKGINILS